MVATSNAYNNFLSGPFASWKTNYDASRAEEPPPGVPPAFNALMTDDGLDFELVAAATPSGPVPMYPKRVITPSSGRIASTAPALGLLVGQIGVPMTQKDGTVWVRLS